MTTSPTSRADATAKLVNGEFYAKGMKIFRAPIETKTATGRNINVGFPVCTVSEYVSAGDVVGCLNASAETASLKERVAELEGTVSRIKAQRDNALLGMEAFSNRAAAFEEALKPFAEFADPRNMIPPDTILTAGSPMARKQITMSDCYAARSALSKDNEHG